MNGPGLSDWQRSTFAERIAEHEKSQPGYTKAWQLIEAQLLAIGGHGVVVTPWPDFNIRNLANNGTVCPNSAVEFVEGLPSQCHRNAAELWVQYGHELWNGYGLTEDDGLWRHHSWVVDRDVLLETTTERDVYWGVPHTSSQALAFSYLHHDDLYVAFSRADSGREAELIELMEAILPENADSSTDEYLRPR